MRHCHLFLRQEAGKGIHALTEEIDHAHGGARDERSEGGRSCRH